MKRSEAIRVILELLSSKDIALFTTGMISREAFEANDRDANFYMFGSMGLCSSLGLGLALNSDKRIFIFDGDGSILMNMGILATIGKEKPANIVHIVLDNQSYQTTGGQPSASSAVQLEKIAMHSGYRGCLRVETIDELKYAVGDSAAKEGPLFVLVKALEKTEDISPRVSIIPTDIKKRFMRNIIKE